MDSATEKLELGLQRLAKAGDDADMLGMALQSLHGALEDFFRSTLSADVRVPAEQRSAVQDPKKVQWKELLDLMQLYHDLGASDRELIWRANGMRTKVAHGGRYAGKRADLERYAVLVQSLCGYNPPPAKPARSSAPKPAQAPAARPPRSTSPPAAPEIPRAVRARSRARPYVSPQRSRLGWSGVLVALGVLLGLAVFVVLRGSAQPLAESAAPSPSAAPTVVAPDPTATPPPTTTPRAATVVNLEGLPLRVRVDHSLSAASLLTLVEGTRVAVLGGPVEADGHIWWNIEVDGQRGWCAGTYLKFD